MTVGRTRDGRPDPSRATDANVTGAIRDASGFRSDFEEAYPKLVYSDLTEAQAFGYQQHMGRRIRERAELAADLILVRMAPLLGVKLGVA